MLSISLLNPKESFTYNFKTARKKRFSKVTICYYMIPVCYMSDPFRRFLTLVVWQNACLNTARHAMMCDVHFFSK